MAVFENLMYKHVLLYRLSHVNTVKLRSLCPSFALVFDGHTATQIRRRGVEPWTTKDEWKHQTDTTTV